MNLRGLPDRLGAWLGGFHLNVFFINRLQVGSRGDGMRRLDPIQPQVPTSATRKKLEIHLVTPERRPQLLPSGHPEQWRGTLTDLQKRR